MQLLLQMPTGVPTWNDSRQQRLMLNMLFATAIVAALLSVLRLPVAPKLLPLTELLVRLMRNVPVDKQPDASPAEVHESSVEQVEKTRASDDTASVETAMDREPVEPLVSPAPGWESLGDAAVSDYLDGLENPPSPNPVLDAGRRAFGDRYQYLEYPDGIVPDDEARQSE